MAFFAGNNGKVVVGSSQVANVVSWDLTVEADELDATCMGSNWGQYITGIRRWSGSLECQWDLTDTSGQKALYDALTGATSVTLYLYTDASKYFMGRAYITSSTSTVNVSDIETITFDFRGTGTLTYT